MRGNVLSTIFSALKEIAGGYFVLRDEKGDEFVILSKQEFDSVRGAHESTEVQLSLPQREQETLNLLDVAEKINREIALYQAGELAEAVILDPAAERDVLADEEAKRVRFEPLRGDLPPELQE